MKTTLYLGTDPTRFECEGHLIHYPIIKIIPRNSPEIELSLQKFDAFTHVIFTSRNAASVFFQHKKDLSSKIVIAIGAATAQLLRCNGVEPRFVSEEETQEGVVKLLETLDLSDAYFFMPRSSLSRPVLAQYFTEKGVRFEACELYDTVTQDLTFKPDLELVDEIVFTSPSTVKAFIEIFKELPKAKKLLAIGPVTKAALEKLD